MQRWNKCDVHVPTHHYILNYHYSHAKYSCMYCTRRTCTIHKQLLFIYKTNIFIAQELYFHLSNYFYFIKNLVFLFLRQFFVRFSFYPSSNNCGNLFSHCKLSCACRNNLFGRWCYTRVHIYNIKRQQNSIICKQVN